jgi:hypothetical protein
MKTFSISWEIEFILVKLYMGLSQNCGISSFSICSHIGFFFAEHIFVLLAAQVDQLGCLAQAYPLILRKPY